MSLPIGRRDFNTLSLAALGGLTAGALTGRAAGDDDAKSGSAPGGKPLTAEQELDAQKDAAKASGNQTDSAKTDSAKTDDAKTDGAKTGGAKADDSSKKKPKEKEKPKEIHVCRGLNTCKGQGVSGENKCAGQGECATTLRAPHECTTMNLCKGQGGCNGRAGRNACDGQGDGPVPLLEEAWPAVRTAFETKMRLLKKKVGAAPPSKDEARWKQRYDADVAEAIAKQEEEDRKAAAEGKPVPKRGPANPPKDVADKDKPKDKAPKVEDDGEKALEELLGDKAGDGKAEDGKGSGEKKPPKK